MKLLIDILFNFCLENGYKIETKMTRLLMKTKTYKNKDIVCMISRNWFKIITIDYFKMKEIKEYIDEYLNTLTEKQKIAYEIAVDMLGTSFDVEKSLGFKKWMKEEKNIDLY